MLSLMRRTKFLLCLEEPLRLLPRFLVETREPSLSFNLEIKLLRCLPDRLRDALCFLECAMLFFLWAQIICALKL
jgi:hypothetical protein